MRPPSDNDIVISGISGRYPKSASLQEFWNNLTSATEMYTEESKRWTSIAGRLPKTAGFLYYHDQFDNDLFGFSDGLANFMDPQQRLLHETTYEALYDAGLDPFSVGGKRAGCFVGSCYNDTNYARVSEQAPKNEKYYGRNCQFVCDTFNLKGVSLTVDTACAASFSALHQAIQAFNAGEVDFAVIGALSVQLRPQVTIGFTNLRMLSPEGKSRSLDAAVDGYCRSEAVVTIILQRRKDAKRIYSSIYHSDTNCDGYKSEGITFPSMEAQYVLMKKVYEECGLEPERHITYVEGHMTGTPVGDPVETYAIVKALRPNKSRPLLMGCLKSNMGHSEGASALCGISKVALIFQQGIIPPNINFEVPNPNIPALRDGLVIPILENTPFDEDFISVNAFGFGGVNVHAILKANEKQAFPRDYDIFKSKYKLPENWYSSRHLHNLAEFDKFTQKNKGNDMIRLVNLTNRTVEGCNYAMDFIEKTRSQINIDFLQLLEDNSFIDPKTKLNHHAYFTWNTDGKILTKKVAKIERKRPLYVVFSGLGCQWVQMGTDLMQVQMFARKIVELNSFTTSKFKFSLIDFITQEMDELVLNSQLTKSLLAISSIQMALVDLIRFLEVDVAAFIGHSVGEYAAAYADGHATSEEILEAIYTLSNLCKETLPDGTMASVGLSWKDCEARLPKDVYICCDNSGENVTIGGSTEAVQKFLKECEKEELFTRVVESCGQVFHARPWTGKIYDQVLVDFKRILGTKKLERTPKWISTSVGKDEEPETLAQYLADNVVKPVYFTDAIRALVNDICCLELGPHAQLLPLIKQEKGRYATCVGSMKRGDTGKNLNNFFVAMGELFNSGVVPKISKLFQQVKYPVSRQTLSISHLLKLDHSVPKFVYRYPEYYNTAAMSRSFEIEFENPKYKSWFGHVIDGRILLPATGYLFLAWDALFQKNTFISANDIVVPVEYHDITLRRAIVLNKGSTTEVKIKIIENTGEFSIIESEQVCCTGFVRMIEDCEKKIDHTIFKPSEDERLEVIKKEDVYKELRVRGYDYQGDFQGIVEVNANGREGKVKYTSSWVAFADALLQVSILGEKSRTLFVPTYIEYLRCEVTTLAAYNELCLKQNVDPIFDVYYDPSIGIGATHGMFVKGMKVTETPRRTEKQKAFLQEYAFTPYENKLKLEKEVSTKLEKYEETVSKLCKAYAKKVEKLEEVELTMKEMKDKYAEKELHSVANLLLDVIKSNYLIPEVEEKKEEKVAEGEATTEAKTTEQVVKVDENNNTIKVDENNNKKEVKLDENNNEIVEEETKEEEKKLDLNETIKERQEELSQDLLFTNSYRQLLTNHIAVAMENLNIKQVKLLEINFTSSLLMDYLTFLVGSLSQARTEYNLLHPMPALKTISNKYGINKVLELKPDNTISGEISASNILVYKHWTTGFVNNLESLDLNYYKPKEDQEKQLIKNTFDHMADSGFFILCYRKKLTLLEEQLMELAEQDTKVEMANKDVLISYVKEAGFEYIGEEEAEEENGCCTIFARKVLKDLVKVKKEEPEKDESEKNETKSEEKTEEAAPSDSKPEEDEMENPLEPIPIEAKLFDYRWVAKVKKQMKTNSKKRIWLIARDSSYNGIVGMMKCLKKEPEGERIRCLFNIDACDDEAFTENKIKNGLLDPSLIVEGDDDDDTVEPNKEEEVKEEKKEEASTETEVKEGEAKAEDGSTILERFGDKKPEKSKDEIEEEEIDAKDENEEELLKLITPDLINKDLAMNIICGGKLGSYRQKKVEEELSAETDYAVLDVMTKGDLSSFRWLKSNMKESLAYPSLLYPMQAKCASEHRFKPFMVDIYYSALNFKDVMVASGRVPRSAYPSTNTGATNLIGMEFSGKLESGKRIMGLLPGSGISTKFLCIDETNTFEVPDKWTLAEAATVPVVYMTAYFSLFIRGKLLPGEKVLIHAGSGGVGFAAISICLAQGCEVFTTVSSKEKREFLQKHFPQLEERNFANSRDINFEEHILKETDGYGVDIVLNSLAEEKLRASIRCLAKFGRFLEIGKYDIISNNPIDTTQLSENRTLHCICLAHLLAETVENIDGAGTIKWNKTCELLRQGIKKGEVIPLNYSLFSKDECEQAFRFMANGKHMGKVLIEVRKEDDLEMKQNIVKVIPKVVLIPIKSYILTGGLGGFGIELALWLIQSGVRRLIITSRTGIKNSYQAMQVRKMREEGCIVEISNEICDTLESTQRLLDHATKLGPLGGIFHLAMILNDSIFTNQSRRLFRKVCKSKVDSTFFLDYLTRDLTKYNALDYFICFSSVASAIGNPGQTNYAFANSAMERMVEKRTKVLGKDSQCRNIAIQWGAIGDVGAFAEKFGNDVSIAGMVPQRIISCMKTMDEVMNYHIPVLSSIVLQDESKIHSLGGDRGSLIKTIMHVLGVNDPSTLDPNVTLTELGMDSLMAVEIKQGLEREYDIVMTTQEIRGLTYKRLQEMSAELEEREKNKGSGESEVEKDNLARLDEIFNSKDELFIELHQTQATASSKPIFFLPPIEGDFVTLRKTCKYITRPVVGISWINEFDEKLHIRDVAAIIVKRLIEKYGICEFDLVGYSFGAVVALEVAIQLQKNTSATVRKLIMLDGSPEFTKAKCHEIASYLEFTDANTDKIMTTMLVKFAEHLTKIDNPEELQERLSKLPDLPARTQSVVQLVESKFNLKIDPETMQRMVKRMYNKCRMVFVCEMTGKLTGDIYLIRASENKSAFIANSVSESYGIEKVCTGKTEFVKLVGDHKTFILNNAKEVGHAIDSQTIYLSI